MGSAGEFKTIPREVPTSRDPKTRVKDFNEIHPTANDELAKTQAIRCMECGIPYCHDDFGCPLENLIPEWNHLVGLGKWEEAVERMLETDTFPEFTGKICPAPCEGSCTMGHYNDQPVTIRQIELVLADKGFENGWIKPQPPLQRTDKKVAIIGSGPAGLAAAFYLNRSGHNVTIYEKEKRAGGLLTYGIPNYKLDKIEIVLRRIQFLEKEGIVFKTNVDIGEDISGKYLKKHFDAIVIAIGAEHPRDLPIKGRDIDGVHYAMEFLSRQSKTLAGESLPNDIDISAKGKTVVIIGGGDTGSDCLGTSHRQGAKEIIQLEITPPPPEARAESNPWPNWPLIYRTSSSQKEGCDRQFNVMTKEFFGDNGKVEGIRCVKVEMIIDEKGMRFDEVPNSDFEIKADLVLLAMGFLGPKKNKIFEEFDLELDARSNIKVNDQMMTSADGVFCSGDATTGQSLVVRAIASAKNCASKVDAYLASITV
ncbi:MAG: glutamate synthase [Planctomycetota bacterium]|nr:MAG: glutamate synthase [Planctomycetota bacterium]